MTDSSISLLNFSRPRPEGEPGYRCLPFVDHSDLRDVPLDSVLDDPPKKGDDPTARLLLGCDDLLLLDIRTVGG